MPQPDFQPVLQSELVVLRPLRAADWDELFAVAADPLIWAVHPVPNRHQEPVFRAFFDSGLASGAALTICDRRSGAIIGSSRYHGYDPDRLEVEIGWTFLARGCWGGAYNRQVKRLMLDHAFRFVDTVIFRGGQQNFRSRRAMEKIGGVLRPGLAARQLDGTSVPYVVYEIRRPGAFPELPDSASG